MSNNRYYKESVLQKIADDSSYSRYDRATYLIRNHRVHVRFCSFDSQDSTKFKYNINPNTLKSDYELWVCGNDEVYYLIPIEIIKTIYNDPDTYVDSYHPTYKVVSISTFTDRVTYATGGKSIDLRRYRNRILDTETHSEFSLSNTHAKISGEGKAHLKLKEWIAENPQFLGLQDVVKAEVEQHILPSGDLPDIVFHLKSGKIISVEIETENVLPGAYQALKYRVLICAENNLPIDSNLIDSFLVAWEIPEEVKSFCKRYGIKYFEKMILP